MENSGFYGIIKRTMLPAATYFRGQHSRASAGVEPTVNYAYAYHITVTYGGSKSDIITSA